jgi:hypothetical protein
MTKIETLELGVQNLETQISQLRVREYELESKEDEKMKEVFSNYFQNVLSDEVVIEVSRNAIYFQMKDESDYLKEIFTIYFRESYSFKSDQDRFTNLSLSYYTTSTNSDFELIRLENLGRVANVFRNFKDQILAKANEIARETKEEIKKDGCLEERWALETILRESRQKITELKKQEQKGKLFGEGLTFEKGLKVRLKSDFEPRVSKLKLISNKSGKTATAEFEYSGHSEGKVCVEENVNVERIISQVISAS